MYFSLKVIKLIHIEDINNNEEKVFNYFESGQYFIETHLHRLVEEICKLVRNFDG